MRLCQSSYVAVSDFEQMNDPSSELSQCYTRLFRTRSLTMIRTPRSMLCSVCSNQDLVTALKPPMVTNRPLAVWRGSHILDLRLHCTFCAFIYEAMNLNFTVSRGGDSQWRDENVYLYASSKDEEPGCRLELQIGDKNMETHIRLVRSTPFIERLDYSALLPGAALESFKPISGRALEESVPWALVRGWVNHCAYTHRHDSPPYCRNDRVQKRAWASCFRLVDVRSMRVVEAQMSWPYVALSYVWGESEPIRLVQQNIEDLMTEGGLRRLKYLPQTFRDAIHVTERLGLDYIWIDALCIQHDDDTDRDHQINGMDQIYREASITVVSVTANANCPMPGVASTTTTRNTTSLRYKAPGIDLMYARPSLSTSIAHSDWESRGWTLQEKFFSKRLLYFTTEQVFFRCANAIWAEDAVLEPPGFQECPGSTRVLRNANEIPTAGLDRNLIMPSIATIFFQYQDLIQQYVTRSLSRDADILSAFTGILNSFENRLGTSIFGLPELVFGVSLLWFGDPKARRRPGFPSWSWCGWYLGCERNLSWLVVTSATGADHAWGWSSKTAATRLIEIHDLVLPNQGQIFRIHDYFRPDAQLQPKPVFVTSKVTIPLPRPLHSLHVSSIRANRSTTSHIVPPDPSLKAYGSNPTHVLEFECDTFFSDEYMTGDVQISLNESLRYDREQGRPPPQSLDFLVLSGSRVNETWFKRRQGTYVPPPAPGMFPEHPTASVNIMLVRTDERGISERIWVFSIVVQDRLPQTLRKTIYLA